jgi:hypothetical protein
MPKKNWGEEETVVEEKDPLVAEEEKKVEAPTPDDKKVIADRVAEIKERMAKNKYLDKKDQLEVSADDQEFIRQAS